MAKTASMSVLIIAVLFFIACCRSVTQKSSQPPKTVHAAATKAFDCLPDDVELENIVSYEKKETTVRDKLVAMKAECDNGKLVDGNKKEIRFFRIACFGNPPYNYDEIQRREQEEIEKLKQNYTVIVMECNPMIQ